ncbi:MAG TPA: hypothetical protein VMD59_01970 [Acidimicrobiales bacterium]|nr:hypothetical protein [Acidimicrobiales bacterium]
MGEQGPEKARRSVREDCRHYVMQTVSRGRATGSERIERCRVGAAESLPFACPQGCLFYEPRSTSAAGWHVGEAR